MTDPVFPLLTFDMLKKLYQGTLKLSQVARQLGVTDAAVKRALWYGINVDRGAKASWAAAALNTVEAGGTAAAAGTTAGGIAAISTGLLVFGALVVVAGGIAAGAYWASHGDQPIEATARGTFDPGRQRNVEPAAVDEGKGVKEPYGIYLAGDYVLVGQRSVIENAPCGSLIGWGLDMKKKVKDVCQLQEIKGGFRFPEEAMNEYDKMKVANSTYILPLARGTVAKFTFGGDKNYHIDNEKRFCR